MRPRIEVKNTKSKNLEVKTESSFDDEDRSNRYHTRLSKTIQVDCIDKKT